MTRPTCSTIGILVCSTALISLCTPAFSESDLLSQHIDCSTSAIDTHDTDTVAMRLSCYNHKLDGLTRVLSNLIPGQQLNGTLPHDTNSNSTIGQQPKTIEHLRLERIDLQTQLQHLISEHQSVQLSTTETERQTSFHIAYPNNEVSKLKQQLQSAILVHDGQTQAKQASMAAIAPSNKQPVQKINKDSLKKLSTILTTQIAGSEADLQATGNEAQNLLINTDEATTDNQTLKNKLATITAQLNLIKNERDLLAAELNVARPEINSLTVENKTIAAENSALLKQIDVLKSGLVQTRPESSALQKQLLQSRNQYSIASKKVNTLTMSIGTLKSILDESLSTLPQIEASLISIKRSLSASRKRIDDKRLELNRLMAEKTALINIRKTLDEETQQLAQVIRQQFQSDSTDSVDIDILPDHTLKLTIGSGRLFRTGRSKLSIEGQAILTTLGHTIAPIETRRILIEGHSDTVPVGAKLAALFKDNAGLSLARAITTAEFLTQSTNVPANNIIISGAGESKPLASNDTPEGRQTNRRVDILLIPAAAGSPLKFKN